MSEAGSRPMDVVIAGLLAGLGVAMPLGAIGVLLVNEGITVGWRTAAAGGTGVALVDFGYASLAVLAGGALSQALTGWEHAVHVAGAVLLVVIAVRGLLGLVPPTRVRALPHRNAGRVVRNCPHSGGDGLSAGSSVRTRRASRTEGPALPPADPPHVPPWRVLARFVGLTAVNPLTAVYFVALAAGLGHTLDGWSRAVVFVLAVFVASLAWQLVLATFGAVAGARLPPAAREVTGVAGYLVVLGYAARLALS